MIVETLVKFFRKYVEKKSPNLILVRNNKNRSLLVLALTRAIISLIMTISIL